MTHFKPTEMLNDWVDHQAHNAYVLKWAQFWLERQKERITEDHPQYQTYKTAWDRGDPYTNASQVLFAYKIVPTSMGSELYVQCLLSETPEPNEWVYIGADNW